LGLGDVPFAFTTLNELQVYSSSEFGSYLFDITVTHSSGNTLT